MTVIINWLIALAVILLFFAGLYLVIKLAVKGAVREALHEEITQLAKKLWEDDEAESADDTTAQS